MGSITSAICASAKSEFMAGGHCFQANVVLSGTTISGNAIITVGSTTGIVLGMNVSGNVIPIGTTISALTSNTSITLSNVASGSTTTNITATGDTFKIALIQSTPTGNYGSGTVNYSDLVANSDEVSGAGYTTGGVILQNISPVASGASAYITFAVNPQWNAATFSTLGAMIYNTSDRLGGTSGTNTNGANRAVAVFNFGNVQTVSGTSFVLGLPPATSSTAILVID